MRNVSPTACSFSASSVDPFGYIYSSSKQKVAMKMFFPNGTIAYPPINGPDIHKYQLTKNLAALGYKITTFSMDQTPKSRAICLVVSQL